MECRPEKPSAWDPANEVVLLHEEEDHALHVRPYFPEAIEVTKCHKDVQQADPHNSAFLRYVATYQAKFSNAFAKEWLNDGASESELTVASPNMTPEWTHVCVHTHTRTCKWPVLMSLLLLSVDHQSH